MRISSSFYLVLALIIILFIAGCGGDGTSPATPPVIDTPAPTVTLTATPATITEGANTTLEWSSTNAVSVKSSNFGATGVNGSVSVSPVVTTTYTITVSGPGGDKTASKVVIQ